MYTLITMFYRQHKNQKGTSLIEIIISSGIFLILSLVIITLISTSYRILSFTRSRTTAKHIAQEKVEYIRNLPFDQVGTAGGIPAGEILQFEQVPRNGLNYTVFTTITYVDDPFDGLSPVDTLPTDYKRIRIDVSWEGVSRSANAPVVIATDISPQGIETAEGGGTLSILVFNSEGLPVPQAEVAISATATTPLVNMQVQTNDNGIIVLPGFPTCVECYNISITKDGYSTDKTYTTTEVANPAKPPASVLENDLTEISFSIDRLSVLSINSHNSRGLSFSTLPNLTFRLRGSKQIGTDVADFPVYKLNEEFTTGASGTVTLTDFEWDTYEIYFDDTLQNYDLSGSNPLNVFVLLPNTLLQVDSSFAAHTDHSLLVTVESNGELVEEASIVLEIAGEEVDSNTTGLLDDPDYGQAFFSNLEEQTYDITVTKEGYEDFEGTVAVSGRDRELILLNPL